MSFYDRLRETMRQQNLLSQAAKIMRQQHQKLNTNAHGDERK